MTRADYRDLRRRALAYGECGILAGACATWGTIAWIIIVIIAAPWWLAGLREFLG